jgi:3-dehydroquinate dehydratase-2
MRKVLVLNGPNLNRLGSREPDVYGTLSYAELVAKISSEAIALGMEADVRQSNDEGQLVEWLHEAADTHTPVILNPAAFTHYSYSLRDACAIVTTSGISLIEVHISNPHVREEFRHLSVISAVASGVIAGFGVNSYLLALRQLSH